MAFDESMLEGIAGLDDIKPRKPGPLLPIVKEALDVAIAHSNLVLAMKAEDAAEEGYYRQANNLMETFNAVREGKAGNVDIIAAAAAYNIARRDYERAKRKRARARTHVKEMDICLKKAGFERRYLSGTAGKENA